MGVKGVVRSISVSPVGTHLSVPLWEHLWTHAVLFGPLVEILAPDGHAIALFVS